jgi:hypothetical protein
LAGGEHAPEIRPDRVADQVGIGALGCADRRHGPVVLEPFAEQIEGLKAVLPSIHREWCDQILASTIIGIEPLLSIRCAKQRLSISEIPVSEPARIGGDRKLQVFRWGAAYLLQTFRELYHWR